MALSYCGHDPKRDDCMICRDGDKTTGPLPKIEYPPFVWEFSERQFRSLNPHLPPEQLDRICKSMREVKERAINPPRTTQV